MKVNKLCLLGLMLFLLSSTVFAANWVLYKGYYIDSDSVIKSDNSFTFWILLKTKNQAVLTKIEAALGDSHQARTLEVDGFKNGQQTSHQMFTDKFTSFAYKRNRYYIDFAFQYAKEGQDTGLIPDISQVPQN